MGRCKIVVAFGTEIASAIGYDEEIDDFTEGVIIERFFETEGERQAYLQGVEDAEGGGNYAELEDYQIKKYEEYIN